MRIHEIEESVAAIATAPFNAQEFPFEFLRAFGYGDSVVERLRAGDTNRSRIGGVLQQGQIHIKTTPLGDVDGVLDELLDAKETKAKRNRVRLVLATDGETVAARELRNGKITPGSDRINIPFRDLKSAVDPFFLPLAGIIPFKAPKDTDVDIQATRMVNDLYAVLVKDNPEWGGEKREDMNKFMARLIFSFYAEDTGVFPKEGMFTETVMKWSEKGYEAGGFISNIFRVMDIDDGKISGNNERNQANTPEYAEEFPYVNGGLFEGDDSVPTFSKIARRMLGEIGSLNWTEINPDIFGSMIQAVADGGERSNLGMHYTSVPNILKVLDPLFLDNLREELDAARNNTGKLTALRDRLARIRVFDPACGSGNFLVIAYKKMREIEALVDRRLHGEAQESGIPVTNFRGIEYKDFAAQIARLAIVIAGYQCDMEFLGEASATRNFLPLEKNNWITRGNALRESWNKILEADRVVNDFFDDGSGFHKIAYENEVGEIYICGNPPYLGSRSGQSQEQKKDIEDIYNGYTNKFGSLDYVSGWFMKAAEYCKDHNATAAFVTTNSVSQGEHVTNMWPCILSLGCKITFALPDFKWSNLATHSASVIVSIIGFSKNKIPSTVRLYSSTEIKGNDTIHFREVDEINAYLKSGAGISLNSEKNPLTEVRPMHFGNHPICDGNLVLSQDEVNNLNLSEADHNKFVRRFMGGRELIHDEFKYCLWIEDDQLDAALRIPTIAERIQKVYSFRIQSKRPGTYSAASFPHRFASISKSHGRSSIVTPVVSKGNRYYIPIGYIPENVVVSQKAFSIPANSNDLWNMSLLCSRMFYVWVDNVCAKQGDSLSFSNTIGWNTFPIPQITNVDKDDLNRCAKNIIKARNRHPSKTLAALYDSELMPAILREAHDQNDEIVERIMVGRRFKHDTDRRESLFRLYRQMLDDIKRGRREVPMRR